MCKRPNKMLLLADQNVTGEIAFLAGRTLRVLNFDGLSQGVEHEPICGRTDNVATFQIT